MSRTGGTGGRRSDRRWLAAGAGVTLLWLAMSAAHAGLYSKTYQFKPNVALDVGTTTQDGLRIDTIRFDVPTAVGGKLLQTRGLLRAEVAISNVSSATRRVGIAFALFDAEARLVGVASGGSQVAGLKAGRQQTYHLAFDSVNAEAFKATTFQISVEAR